MNSQPTSQPADKFKPWRDYLENILIAIFLALFVRTYIITGYKVPTGSMAPTLKPGDFIFAYKLPFGFKLPFSKEKIAGRSPERGQVVIFTYPDQPRTSYIKRVIGLPGDVVEIVNGQVSLNGQIFKYTEGNSEELSDLPSFQIQKVLKESAPEGQRSVLTLRDGKKSRFGPIVVPPGEVFLLGDNRDASDDSRYWGSIPIQRVEGQLALIWLSLNWQRPDASRFPKVRWDRVMTIPK